MSGLVEIVAAGAASAQALSAIIPQLNGTRSVLIEIDNSTDATLRRVRDHHDHGGFAVTPHTEIPPLHADVFGAQSSAFSIGTGTEGSIDYEGLGMGFSISWVNPFIGENEIGASVPGGNLSPLRIVTTKGAGNEAAHMRYEVFPSSPTWSHGLPSAASSTKVAAGTSPISWHTTPENVQHIAYVGEDQKIHELFFFVGGDNTWRHSTPGDASPVKVATGTSPTSWYTTPENVQHIAYVGEDQKIHELFFFVGGDNTWRHSTPGDASPVKVATGTSPTSWYTTPENVQHIAYVGEDQRIHQCFFFVGGFGGWRHETPGDVSPVKVAVGTTPTSWYTTPENVQHIAYVGDDRQIHELFFFVRVGESHTWIHSTPSAGKEKVAERTSPTSWYTTSPTNVQHVAYVGATDEQIHELYFMIGGDNGWHDSVPSAGHAQVLAGRSTTSWYTTPENVQHIAYVGASDQKIHECFFFIR